jgi:hypothetical protein
VFQRLLHNIERVSTFTTQHRTCFNVYYTTSNVFQRLLHNIGRASTFTTHRTCFNVYYTTSNVFQRLLHNIGRVSTFTTQHRTCFNVYYTTSDVLQRLLHIIEYISTSLHNIERVSTFTTQHRIYLDVTKQHRTCLSLTTNMQYVLTFTTQRIECVWYKFFTATILNCFRQKAIKKFLIDSCSNIYNCRNNRAFLKSNLKRYRISNWQNLEEKLDYKNVVHFITQDTDQYLL